MLIGLNKHQIKYATVTLLIIVASLFSFMIANPVEAADLANRSVDIGTSEINTNTTHTYKFRVETGLTIGSFEIEYCTNSPFIGTACSAPAGFSLISSSIGAQTGLTGFGIDPSSTINKLILSRIPAGVSPPVNATITINNVLNPSTPNQTTFIRISTFATNDATGIRGDRGTVVFSTARQLTVNGYVPPYLTFCVGNIVSSNCSNTIGNYIDFGELRTSSTRSVTSQFAVATNDVTGYTTSVNGLTLTSGNNIINPLAVPTISQTGVSQFGMNLRANSSPVVGSDISGVGTGIISSDFNNPNNYVFKTGNLVSSSLSTEFNVYTVSYIANVSTSQAPGVYISTITFITTVSF